MVNGFSGSPAKLASISPNLNLGLIEVLDNASLPVYER